MDGGAEASAGSLISWFGWLLLVILAVASCCVSLRVCLTVKTRRKLTRWLRSTSFDHPSSRPFVVGFFHPYCNAGGGGERVLWHAIHALQNRYDFVHVVVYTGDVEASEDEILGKVHERFGISLPRDVLFVYLRSRKLVEASTWPRLTMLMQSLGSCILGLEALFSFVPHLYVDSMGYAFTVPLFRYIGGCRTASYVHYPTVSTDMIDVVQSGKASFNNSSIYASNSRMKKIKVFYYKAFAKLYGAVGRRNQVVMVNSSWTYEHIKTLWGGRSLSIVYPPCDTSAFQDQPVGDRASGPFYIVSLGQFRPEKNHEMQFEVIRSLRAVMTSSDYRRMRLVLVGGCRNQGDKDRVEWLRMRAEELKVTENVEFKLNVSFPDLRAILGSATVGVHTMCNEHFGISLVEMMAAGAIIVADNSGGPKMDIVKDWKGRSVGYLASTVEEYAGAIGAVYKMKSGEREAMVEAAREAVNERFSVDAFQKGFLRSTECLFTS